MHKPSQRKINGLAMWQIAMLIFEGKQGRIWPKGIVDKSVTGQVD